MSYSLKPIGVIRSPFDNPAGTPIQPAYSSALGTVEVFEEFKVGLKDIELFSHIFLIYWFDRAGAWKPLVVPYRDIQQRGIFAVRAPLRPNPIGISVVKLLNRRGRTLEIKGVDILNGTPLIDLKPYVPKFDSYPKATSGWLNTGTNQTTADSRF